MATPVYLRSSSVPSKIPTSSSLALRELGVNIADGRLFVRQGTGLTTDNIFIVNPWTQSVGNTTAFNLSFTGGNVGIGTTLPSQSLHVSGNVRVSGFYYDSNNNFGLPNQVLLCTGTGTSWGPIELGSTINQLTFGNYITGTPLNYFNGVTPVTFGVAATSLNTINQVVARDTSGNFSANTVTVSSTVYSTVFDTLSATITTTSTALAVLSSSLSSTTYRTVEFLVQAVQGANYHSTKLLLVHDGTNAYLTEYGTILVGASVATFDADISGEILDY